MAYKQLTLEQRYEIKAFMQAGFSMLSILKLIGVNKSTVSREVKRNSGQRGYRAKQNINIYPKKHCLKMSKKRTYNLRV